MTFPIHLTKITTAKLPEAVRMARAIFPNEVHKGVFWPDWAYRQAIAEDVTDFAYYIASHQSWPVGITGHYAEKGTMWLGWFGVLKACRNKGYGSAILQKTCDIVHQLGHKEIRLYSGAEEHDAHKLYFRHGFEQYRRGQVDKRPVRYFRAVLPLGEYRAYCNGCNHTEGLTLICQDVMPAQKSIGIDKPWVFRYWLCRWHLAVENRHRAKEGKAPFKRLVPASDEEVLRHAN